MQTVAKDFWSITPENLFKWFNYEPKPGNVAGAYKTLQQQYIDFAADKKIPYVRGHALDWGYAYMNCVNGNDKPCFWPVQDYDCKKYAKVSVAALYTIVIKTK